MQRIQVPGPNGDGVEKFYFVQDSIMCDEDATTEFKGHMNMSVEEVPAWCSDSRQPISKTLNSFLNNGTGGVTYLGVLDTGKVEGIFLNQYKMDHMKASLEDLMSRYSPPVEPHRYSLEFIPVASSRASEQEILNLVNYDPSRFIDLGLRRRSHVLRTHSYCWCDKELMAQNDSGVCLPEYVIKITIPLWDSSDPRNKNGFGWMNIYPIHEDEVGKVFRRRDASTMQCNAEDLRLIAVDLVNSYYEKQVEALKKEKQQLLDNFETQSCAQ